MQAIDQMNKAWEDERKAKLVTLGQSSKPYGEIVTFLENEIRDSTRMTKFKHTIHCFRSDGIYQLHRAIEDVLGATQVQDKKAGMSDPSTAVDTIDVILADGRRVKVPYGKIDLPSMGEDAFININYHYDLKVMLITGECQFKFQGLVDTVIAKTINYLKTDSIYRNQALVVDSAINHGQPEVLDLFGIDSELMILSEKTTYDLGPIKARLLHADRCKEKGIPLKYGALLAGPYGTGKTLLAFKLGKEATENNWSFIYLRSPELLAETLRMAKTLDNNGNGILVFVEDIDQVTRGERGASLQEILNTLDGGDTKNMNVIALFTTNHIELIEPTFLRGKRIGTIISMPFLDVTTAQAYLDKFCPDTDFIGDFAPVLELIAKSNIAPAFMVEILENLKSNMLLEDKKTITAAELKYCVESYIYQVELSRTKDTSVTREQRLATALRENIHTPEFYDSVAAITREVMNEE